MMAYTDLQMRAFTQIAYMDLKEGYLRYLEEHPGEPATLSAILPRPIPDGDGKLYDPIQKLLTLGVTQEELDSWTISFVHDANDENGFYACVIETSPGDAVIAFRGSESTNNIQIENDWVKADIGLVNSTCTNQHAEIDKFFESAEFQEILNKYDHISMTGHSLGGNLAEYGAIMSAKYGWDDKLVQCESLDGPGFSDEFIAKYEEEIKKVSSKMYHPRWSCVGALLFDLPGVNYKFVSVSNEANSLDEALGKEKKEYNCLTRHDTKYTVIDENGYFVDGEQDELSKITRLFSEGVDHMPTAFGDAIVTIVGSLLINGVHAKDAMFKDGKVTPIGHAIILGCIYIVTVIGAGNPIKGLLISAVALINFVFVVAAGEFIYEHVVAAVDAFCTLAGQLYNWTVEKVLQLKDGVLNLISSVVTWYNKTFNKGYKYSSANPYIKVDTVKLRDYASRIANVNRRLKNLDGNLRSLYSQVGFLDLWDILMANLITCESYTLSRVQSYLNNAGDNFDTAESSAGGYMGG